VTAAWPISPALYGGTGPFDVDYDQNGNVYIDMAGPVYHWTYVDPNTGNTINVYDTYNYLSKYDPTGVFQWTISLSPGGGHSNESAGYADFCVIPSGSIFIASGFDSTFVNGGFVTKISPAGFVVAKKLWPNAYNQEGWVINYNKCSNVLLVGGGGTANYISMKFGIDTSLAGTFNGNNFNGASGPNDCADNMGNPAPCYGNDMARMLIDDNGDMYAYFASNPDMSSNNKITKSVSPYSTNVYNKTRSSGSSFYELTSIPGYVTGSNVGTCNRLNVMDINSSFIYFFDGKNLEAHSKATGTQIATTVVSAGYAGGGYNDFFNTGNIHPVAKNEGIAVDACNNVYVGGQGKVHEYNFNGTTFTPVTTYAVPGNVYDIMLDKVNHYLYVVGNGFVTSLTVTACSSISLAAAGACGSGTVTVNITGGTAPYTYSWSNGASGISTVVQLTAAPGTYNLVVSDASCNKSIQQGTVTIPPFVTAAAASATASTCLKSNGQVNATAGGGTGPYTYLWTGGGTTPIITNLPAGPYTVTITDSKGCTATSATTIASTGGGVVAAIAAGSINVDCKGNSTGSATASPSGSSGYSYLWSPGGATTQTISNLAAATYVVTITDVNSCTSSASVIITQPTTVLSASVTPSSSLCLPNSGTATANALGGTVNYTYLWNDPSASTTQVINGLASGTYAVTVTDSHGCITTATTTITGPSAALNPVTGSDSSTCTKNNGSVFANPTGGTPGYSYTWSPGGVGQTINNLASGTYSLTVTDKNGCSQTAIQTVSDAGGATISLNGNPVIQCFAGNNGTATATVTGGTAPLAFVWSTGLSGTTTSTGFTSVISGLDSGIYVINVTDVHGCLSSSSITLHAPPQINPIISSGNQTNVTCNGLTNGQATLTTSGGTGTIGYAWPPSAGNSVTATATNLAPGTYVVTVTDANSCSVTTSVIITQPNPLGLFTTYVGSVCGNPNGSVSAFASGGTVTYNYVWTPGGPGQTITGLIPGSYQVVVTDNNGCTFSASQSVSDSGAANVTLSGPSATICIGQPAILSANVVGGILPFKYNWSTGDTIPGPLTVTPATTTIYSLIVTDAKGCTSAVQTDTVKVNKPLSVKLSSTGLAVCNGASATITAAASGGNGNYSYTWFPSGSGASFTINPTANVTYFVTVTDNCDSSVANAPISFTVDVPPTVSISSGENSGCSDRPVCIQFTGTSNPPGACVSTEWYFGDSDSSSQANPIHCYNAAGAYTVSMKCTDAKGCSSISAPGSSIITIIQSPKAAFTYSPSTLLTQDSAIAFTNHSSVTAVSWNFGDTASLANDSSILVNPTHAYKDSGAYCIRLIAFNAGCVDTVKHCIFINEACTLPKQIPNVFSPNEDGINDIFTIKSTGLRDLLCTMYNRWGMEIYQYDAIKTGWDGRTFSDGKAPEGTYYYVLKADCLTSPDQLKGQGFLQLVR